MRKQTLTVIAATLLLSVTVTMAADIDQGLVAWYSLNGNALDVSGHGKNGTNWGATSVADRFGNAGSALRFDGSNDYVALPGNNPVWLPQNDFTISAWARFNATPRSNQHDFVLDLDFAYSGDPANCLGYSIFRSMGAGKAVFQLETATASNAIDSPFSLSQDTWYHIVGVRSGSTQQLYLDGQLSASGICSALPIQFNSAWNDYRVNLGTMSDGFWTSGTYYLNGMIDDVRIYNRALSGEEIQMLYNVPEPATLLLLGLGVGILRKKS